MNTEDTNEDKFYLHLRSARSIVDLITTMAGNGDTFEELEPHTLAAAGITALDHLAEARAATAAFDEKQEAKS